MLSILSITWQRVKNVESLQNPNQNVLSTGALYTLDSHLKCTALMHHKGSGSKGPGVAAASSDHTENIHWSQKPDPARHLLAMDLG